MQSSLDAPGELAYLLERSVYHVRLSHLLALLTKVAYVLLSAYRYFYRLRDVRHSVEGQSCMLGMVSGYVETDYMALNNYLLPMSVLGLLPLVLLLRLKDSNEKRTSL